MKTKNPPTVSVIFMSLLVLILNSSESMSDVVVVFPPELGITKNVNTNKLTKTTDISQELLAKIPSAPYLCTTSTIGQLTKKADAIIVSKVKRITRTTIVKDALAEPKYQLEVEVIANLCGGIRKKTLILPYEWDPLDSNINVGDYVLIFLSPHVFFVDINEFNFNYSKTATTNNKTLLIFGGARGVLKLNLFYEKDEVFKAVKNYVNLLRCEKRDYKKYYDFLKSVTKSKHTRLIEDGNSDLLILLRKNNEINLHELLSDEELDPNIKEYIRAVMIPHKEKKLKQEAEQ